MNDEYCKHDVSKGLRCGPCEDEIDRTSCTKPPPGWRCSREDGHEGPCAAERKVSVTMGEITPEMREKRSLPALQIEMGLTPWEGYEASSSHRTAREEASARSGACSARLKSRAGSNPPRARQWYRRNWRRRSEQANPGRRGQEGARLRVAPRSRLHGLQVRRASCGTSRTTAKDENPVSSPMPAACIALSPSSPSALIEMPTFCSRSGGPFMLFQTAVDCARHFGAGRTPKPMPEELSAYDSGVRAGIAAVIAALRSGTCGTGSVCARWLEFPEGRAAVDAELTDRR
jgi:hypothetical protein